MTRHSLAGVALVILSGCSGGKITPLDATQLTSESYEDMDCVTRNRGDAGAMSRCREDVKLQWDVYWAARFADGGSQ